MIVLYNKGLLYAKVIMNLKFKMEYNGRVLDNKRQEDLLLLPEEVMHVLQRNGDLKIWNGEKYIKLNLGQFYDIMQNKRYNVVEYVEPKQEVKVEVKQEEKQQPKAQPKVEVKQEEKKQESKVQPKEEVKVEPKPEVKVEVKQEEKQQPKEEVKHDNENKKQRHNKQGGDK